MLRRIIPLISLSLFILIIVSCSNDRGINPILPSGSDDLSSSRQVSVKPMEDTFWNTSIGVDGENWIAHMDEYGRIVRALGKGVDAGEPKDYIENHFNLFGVTSSDLIDKRDGVHDGMRTAIYRQSYNGIEIENSLVRLIYGRGGHLVSYGAKTWSGYSPAGTWNLSGDSATDLASGYDDSKFIESQKVYFAKDGSLIPSWRVDFDVNSYLVSAIDGETLETHQNRYEWNHDGHITGGVKPFSPLDDDIPVDMYGVNCGFYSYDQYYSGFTYSDMMGDYSFNHNKQYRYLNLRFDNPWYKIEQAWDSGMPTFNYWMQHNAANYQEIVIDNTMSSPAERNLQYYLAINHDWFWTVEPDFDLMDFQLPVFADKTGKCTAYAYTGGNPSIHFFQPFDNCTNTGESPSIIYHEYGHIYVSKIYVDTTGTLHEANADTMANRITQHYMVGPDLYGADTYRRVSNNRRMWPAPECEGETPHCVGNVLAGAHWDLSELIGHNLMDHHWHFVNYLNSTDFNEKAADFILVDDDDDDVTNGCPNYDEIYEAFFVDHNLAVPDITNPQTTGVILDIVPMGLPHVIERLDGGTFGYHFRLENLDDTPTVTQVWTAFKMPDGTFYGPVRPPSHQIAVPYTVPLDAYQVYEFDLYQDVPPYVPAETYFYHVRVGEYVDHVNDILMDEGVFEVVVR